MGVEPRIPGCLALSLVFDSQQKPEFILCEGEQDRQYTYNVTLRRFRVPMVAVGNQVLHIQSVSVTLVIQHETCTHRIILPSVSCLDLTYFSTIAHKRYDVRGGGVGSY